MFETTWNHTSTSSVADEVSDQAVISLLHDFGTVIHFNPDCKAYQVAAAQPKGISVPEGSTTYDCEDALTFIPKKLWDGGVWYTAVFTPDADGCTITIKAPAFSSTNKWKLQTDRNGKKTISTISDAKCNKTFAGFVKKFLENSHQVQQRRFTEQLGARRDSAGPGEERPGVVRRRSSWPEMR